VRAKVGIFLRRHRRRALPLMAAMALAMPLLVGWHWAKLGWRDWHHNYPAVPNGYTQIVNRFGQPCSTAARAVYMYWRAADTGTTYSVRFHRKLGGYPTQMVSGKGGVSTNLDNDVYGHIQNNHLSQYVKHGIYGYARAATSEVAHRGAPTRSASPSTSPRQRNTWGRRTARRTIDSHRSSRTTAGSGG
jgi:hypothetical protein